MPARYLRLEVMAIKRLVLDCMSRLSPDETLDVLERITDGALRIDCLNENVVVYGVPIPRPGLAMVTDYPAILRSHAHQEDLATHHRASHGP